MNPATTYFDQIIKDAIEKYNRMLNLSIKINDGFNNARIWQ